MEYRRRGFLKTSAAGLAALPFASQASLQAAAAIPPKSMGSPKFADVDGIKTRYFEAGSGEAMVLVHGGHFGMAGSANGFRAVFGHLAAHFHLYAVDKLGMGFTDNPTKDEDYSMHGVIRHVYGFIQKMGLKKVHLVGHSRGALPVTRVAIDHPDLVKTLTLFDSNTLAPDNPATPPRPPDPQGELPTPTQESIRHALMTGTTYVHKTSITDEFIQGELEVALLPKIREAEKRMKELGRRYAQAHPDLAKKYPGFERATGATVWWLYEAKNETLEMIKAAKLKTPTLIIWGFNDVTAPYVLGIDLMKMVNAVVDRAQFHVFNRSGHSPYAEYPDEVTRLIVDFVKAS